jgi:hypothetical protein
MIFTQVKLLIKSFPKNSSAIESVASQDPLLLKRVLLFYVQLVKLVTKMAKFILLFDKYELVQVLYCRLFLS